MGGDCIFWVVNGSAIRCLDYCIGMANVLTSTWQAVFFSRACVEEGARSSTKEQRVRVEDGGGFEDEMAAVMRTESVDAVYRMLGAARISSHAFRVAGGC